MIYKRNGMKVISTKWDKEKKYIEKEATKQARIQTQEAAETS